MTQTDDYVNIFLALPQMSPVTVLSVFFLTLARILPIMTVAPFLGAKNLPMTIRMMFSVALVAIFFPQNLLSVNTQIALGMPFIGLMLKELLIGACIGFFSAAPFFIAQMSGSLIDHSRGASSLQVNDPTTQTQASPIGLVYNYVLIAVFYSYLFIPVDKGLSAEFFSLQMPFWKQAFGLGEHMYDMSIQLAAPALIGVLLTDLFLGIANRLAPQVQIVFLGMPLKSWVGLALMTVAWVLIIQVMGKESISWFKALNQLIRQSAGFVTK